MKVAFTTGDGVHVDSHFGWAKRIAIYDITPEDCRLINYVEFGGNQEEDGSNEDKLGAKLDAVKDCAILYVAAIGGSGAARVVAKNILPVKVAETAKIEDILLQLQKVLSGNPPPWLRKALNKGRERVLDFEDEVIYG
jgi:nitrogen fixation protein NifX